MSSTKTSSDECKIDSKYPTSSGFDFSEILTILNPSSPFEPIVYGGTTAPVPEPGTLLLLSFGLLIAVGCKKGWKADQNLWDSGQEVGE